MRTSITLLVAAVLLFPLTANASVINIPGDYPTIQGGVNASSDGDSVVVADGTYTGDGNRDLDFLGKAIVVMSENGPEVTIIDCEGSAEDPHRGFYFHSGEDNCSVVQGFTITNGYIPGQYSVDFGGAGIRCVDSSPKIIENIITGNSVPEAFGGGIFCFDTGFTMSPVIVDNSIVGNNARDGGAIACHGLCCSAVIADNMIAGNTANYGGGIMCHYESPNLVIAGNTIRENQALYGGGIYCHMSSPLITNNIISNNTAPCFGGGGIYVREYHGELPIWIPTLTGNTIVENTAPLGWWGGYGGAIWLDSFSSSTVLTVTNSILWGNSAWMGDEVYITGPGSIIISYSDIQDGYTGTGNIDQNPLFVTGPEGDYYLSQTAAGQTFQSPCVDAGDPFSPIIQGWSSTNEIQDAGVVDMGYHFGYRRLLPPCGHIRPCAAAGLIAGSVTPNYEGLTVDLLDNQNVLLSSTRTSGDGSYSFPDLEPGDYIVELIEPLGFSVNQNNVTVLLIGVETATVDFELTPLAISNDARSKGYWKHQVNANLSGRGNVDYTASELLDFSQEIFDHFYMNVLNPIEVEGVTFVGDPAAPSTLSDLQEMLTINQRGSTMYQRACQHYLALLLNVVSDKLGQYFEASDDGATVSQAIVYIDQLIGTDDELGKDIAETLNQGQTVAAGVIPLETPNIIFRDGIEAVLHPFSFRLDGAVPNPFNATTVINYQLPVEAHVKLEVYNILGEKVATLVNEKQEPGSGSVVWDASKVSSGVYFYKLTAGDYTETRRMMLVK